MEGHSASRQRRLGPNCVRIQIPAHSRLPGSRRPPQAFQRGARDDPAGYPASRAEEGRVAPAARELLQAKAGRRRASVTVLICLVAPPSSVFVSRAPQAKFASAQKRILQLNRSIQQWDAQLTEEEPNNIAALQENKRVRPFVPMCESAPADEPAARVRRRRKTSARPRWRSTRPASRRTTRTRATWARSPTKRPSSRRSSRVAKGCLRA